MFEVDNWKSDRIKKCKQFFTKIRRMHWPENHWESKRLNSLLTILHCYVQGWLLNPKLYNTQFFMRLARQKITNRTRVHNSPEAHFLIIIKQKKFLSRKSYKEKKKRSISWNWLLYSRWTIHRNMLMSIATNSMKSHCLLVKKKKDREN